MGNRASPLGLLFPGCGPFWSCASGMTLQDLSKKPVGLSLCRSLAEPLPVLRLELGKDGVITRKVHGLHG